MMKKLFLLVLIIQMMPELNAQSLNTIGSAFKVKAITQQNSKNSMDYHQKKETVTKEVKISANQQNREEKDIENKKKIVEHTQESTPVVSKTIMKHGMEFSISKIIPEKSLDLQKIVSPDELVSLEKQNKEYFNKKYLNKEIVVMGAFDSISRRDRNYKLKIDRFDSSLFSTSFLSCSFSDIRDLKPLIQLLDIDNYYVLVKGIVSSSNSLKNCIIVGVAKLKI